MLKHTTCTPPRSPLRYTAPLRSAGGPKRLRLRLPSSRRGRFDLFPRYLAAYEAECERIAGLKAALPPNEFDAMRDA